MRTAILLIAILFGPTWGQDEKRRIEALVPLIEMARWRGGHAYDVRILLARIAGIDEERAEQLANADNIDEIMKALQLAGSLP